MTKQTKFFQCFSINLHNFLKSSGLQHMNDGEHVDGINIGIPTDDPNVQEWRSFPNLYEAAKQTGLELKDLQEIHAILKDSQEGSAEMGNYKFAKRVRRFWVYQVDPTLEKALRKWKETGPKGTGK